MKTEDDLAEENVIKILTGFVPVPPSDAETNEKDADERNQQHYAQKK